MTSTVPRTELPVQTSSVYQMTPYFGVQMILFNLRPSATECYTKSIVCGKSLNTVGSYSDMHTTDVSFRKYSPTQLITMYHAQRIYTSLAHTVYHNMQCLWMIPMVGRSSCLYTGAQFQQKTLCTPKAVLIVRSVKFHLERLKYMALMHLNGDQF